MLVYFFFEFVALNKQQEDYVLALVTQMHLGRVRLLEQPLEGVVLNVPRI